MMIMESEHDLLLAVEQMIERDRYRPSRLRWGIQFEHELRQDDDTYQWVTRYVWLPSRQHAAERLRLLLSGAGVLGQQLTAGRLRCAVLCRGKPLISHDKPELDSDLD
jgi:hypothetical protein